MVFHYKLLKNIHLLVAELVALLVAEFVALLVAELDAELVAANERLKMFAIMTRTEYETLYPTIVTCVEGKDIPRYVEQGHA